MRKTTVEGAAAAVLPRERRDRVDAVTFQREAMRHERLMYHISYSMLQNNEDCADAVQEALTRAWQKRESLRREDRFRQWLMKILVNTCKDLLRRRQKVRFVPLEDETVALEPPSSPLPLQEAIDMLKPELRVVLVLHYMEGYSVADMAVGVGLPTGTVKSRMKTAREKLSTLLHEEWEGQQ